MRSKPIRVKWEREMELSEDSITPYPCMTCKVPYRTVTTLRNHKCQGARRYANAD